MSNELLDEFIFDSRDHLNTAGAQLLDLEKNPASLNALNALMGTMHTIKGNSGFLDLQNLYKLMHHAESLLQTVREKQCPCPQDMIDLLLQVLDTVEALLSRLENGENDSVDWLDALNQALSESEAKLEAGDEEAEAPVEAPAAAAAPAPKKAAPPSAPVAPVVIQEDLSGRVDVIILDDGQLSEEGAPPWNLKVEAMFKAGLSGLVVDLRNLSSVSSGELKQLMGAARKNPAKTAFLVDMEAQEALVRVFKVLRLDSVMSFFADEAEARQGIALHPPDASHPPRS